MHFPPEPHQEAAERLIERVCVFPDPEVECAWSDEIANRIRDIDEGRVQGIPATDVLREARKRIDAIHRAASAGDV